MKRPLDRLNRLTMAAESALASNDLSGFRALVDARQEEISKLNTPGLDHAEETLRLDSRLQGAANARLAGLRTRMSQLGHVSRTIRAAQAARSEARQIDLSG